MKIGAIIILIVDTTSLIDTPPNSLIDSIANLKVKIVEG
jgi:hypothetical protein